jgi:hypothetical protein
VKLERKVRPGGLPNLAENPVYPAFVASWNRYKAHGNDHIFDGNVEKQEAHAYENASYRGLFL